MHRRSFLSGAAAGITGLAGAGPASTAKPRKAVIHGMVRGGTSVAEKFAIIARAGFDGVEVPPTNDPAEQKEFRAAADKAHLQIHSIIYGWAKLSDPDPAVRAAEVEKLENGL